LTWKARIRKANPGEDGSDGIALGKKEKESTDTAYGSASLAHQASDLVETDISEKK